MNNKKDLGNKTAPATGNTDSGRSVFADRKKSFAGKKKGGGGFKEKKQEEFEQKIVDVARVTRVMAGGKRMRFRACVAIGDKKGRIAIGLAKGADVTMAINKAVSNAKKEMIEVSIVNETIPHQISHKKGAAQIILKPASKGRGVIAGGAIRTVLELSGIKNITSKNLGTNNKVSVAKCTIEALNLLKKIEKKREDKPVEKKADEIATVSEKEEKSPEVAKDASVKKEGSKDKPKAAVRTKKVVK